MSNDDTPRPPHVVLFPEDLLAALRHLVQTMPEAASAGISSDSTTARFAEVVTYANSCKDGLTRLLSLPDFTSEAAALEGQAKLNSELVVTQKQQLAAQEKMLTEQASTILSHQKEIESLKTLLGKSPELLRDEAAAKDAATISQLSTEVAGLKGELLDALRKAAGGATPPATTPLTKERREKMPAPPKFKGESAEAFQEWRSAISLKLSLDKAMFPSVEHQLVYLFGSLEGKAKSILAPYFRNGVLEGLKSVPDAIQMLANFYQDPIEKETAAMKLERLQMRHFTFTQYLTEFTRLINLVDWDPSNALLVYHLKKGLSRELKEATLFRDLPEEYSALCAALLKIDSQMRHHKLELNMKTPGAKSFIPKPASTTSASSDTLGPAPMDLSAAKTSPEEAARRKAKDLCSYCGEAGHWIQECPDPKCKVAEQAKKQKKE